ncbi:hypothetical protein J7T55_004030 [Diaporthe amygdali]|uniref:uncharacterized protein n=1 Tax=Phomopsis amygdali TaxID=1214568 RepID=UPI0022FE7448|nr:uncharacterized protein J7T55_004030 [Diaporthe amygdali]KAJ0115861.1 hypothetical protein J7T55_004030 [Diaporthe amygdali]
MEDQNMDSSSKVLHFQGSRSTSPEQRNPSGTLPPQAAEAPEFVPGGSTHHSVSPQHTNYQQGDQKTSDTSPEKGKSPKKKLKKLKKAEKRAEDKAQKERAMEEEWWSGDDVLVPNLK